MKTIERTRKKREATIEGQRRDGERQKLEEVSTATAEEKKESWRKKH